MDCIFCKILKGEVPCTKIAENENSLAFLDLSPVHKGHCLVIPKKHYGVIDEMSDEDLTSLINLTKKNSSKNKRSPKL